MMSFLKSILWKKSEVNQTVQQLSDDIVILQKKIEDLENDTELLKMSMKEMTLCIQNITLVMHSLSQEVLTIVTAIKGSMYSDEADTFSMGFDIDDEDGELLN